MSAEAKGVGADFVEGTMDVRQPVGEDGVRVAEDVTPEVVVRIVAESMRMSAGPGPRPWSGQSQSGFVGLVGL